MKKKPVVHFAELSKSSRGFCARTRYRFCNENNERYTLRYNLPPDTPERTERRVSLLLYLLRKHRSAEIDNLAD